MKRFLALFLALLMVLSMAACARTEVAKEPAVEEAVTEDNYVVEDFIYYPTTVTDQADRKVMIRTQPERIVSGYYISTSLLMALGYKDKLVGIEAKADKRPIYSLSAPELIELPNVGTAKEFDLEGCIALEPDLVILPLKLKEAAAALEELEIPVLLVNPESRTQLADMTTLIAKALNCEDKAAALFEFTSNTETFIAETIGEAEKPTVYLAGNSSLLSTAGGKMYQSDLIDLAGGVNVAAEIEDTYWVEVSYEQLLAWDPDYIILASDAAYTAEDVLADHALAGCKAVANGKVYQMPAKAEAWDSPVPGGILGALWMAGKLHADLMEESEVYDSVQTFYSLFYGFEYTA